MEKSIIYTCLTEGDFKLHSGQRTRYLFDTMKLIRNNEFLREFCKFVQGDFLVGIEYGGSILSAINAGYRVKFAIIRKDGTIYGDEIPKNYVIIDDVVTTENSVRLASKQIYDQLGCHPSKIKCIVDRRKKENKSLHIESMLEWEEV